MTSHHLSQEKARTDEKDLGVSGYNKQKVSLRSMQLRC